MRIPGIAIAASALLVSACASIAQPDGDKRYCDAEAKRAFPPSLVESSPTASPMFVPTSYTTCHAYGKILQCSTQFSPTFTEEVEDPPYDSNAGDRQRAFESCMATRASRTGR